MMSVVLAMSLTLAPTDETAVLVARRNGIPQEDTKRLAASIVSALRAAGFANTLDADETNKRLKAADISDTLGCGARVPCLISAGLHINVKLAVMISGSQVDTDRAWVLEVYDVAHEVLVERLDWAEPADAPNPSKPKLLALNLSKKVPATAPKADTPTQVTLTPTTTQPTVKKESPRKPLPTALVVGSSVVAVAAITCAVIAVSLNADVQNAPNGISPRSQSATQQLADTSNAFAVGAIGAGVVAAGLGVGAALTW